MVVVNEADRDVLRFPWVKDPFASEPKGEIKRFTHLVFGVLSSPFLLNVTIRHHMEALYVEDLSTGDRNVEETYQLVLKSKLRVLEAGFNMKKWSPSSKELIETTHQSTE